MISLNSIKGQDSAIRYLLNSSRAGRISGSYLFSGPRGVGRALTARAFLSSLMCREKEFDACSDCVSCRKIESGTHPDVKWIKPEKNKKIRIDEIRQVKEVLSLKPFEGLINVCVLEDAHMMTTEASNALLKLLEEPPGASVIILITDKKDWLLSTVLSRCAEVRFRCLSTEDTAGILREEASIGSEEALFLAWYAQGSPGRALEMMEEGILERKTRVLEMAEEIAREKNPSCVNWDTDLKDELMEDIEILIMIFRDAALLKTGLGDLVLDRSFKGDILCGEYSLDRIYSVVSGMVRAKSALSGNVNPKLVAQALPGMMA